MLRVTSLWAIQLVSVLHVNVCDISPIDVPVCAYSVACMCDKFVGEFMLFQHYMSMFVWELLLFSALIYVNVCWSFCHFQHYMSMFVENFWYLQRDNPMFVEYSVVFSTTTQCLWNILSFSALHVDVLQHYMSMFVASLTIPILLAPAMCMGEDNVGKSEIIGTLFVTSGIITLMQNLIGVRYVYVVFGYAIPLPLND